MTTQDLVVHFSILPLVSAALMTPGYITLFMISRFTTGRPAFAASLAISSAYYVVVWSLFGWELSVRSPKRFSA